MESLASLFKNRKTRKIGCGKHLKECKHANPTQVNATQGHYGPEKGQGFLLRLGKGLGTPDALESVGLSNVIPLECVASVSIKCQVMYAIRQG